MVDTPIPLADDFAPVERGDWLKLVQKTLEGGDFEQKLVGRTVDGLEIQPLYTPADAVGVAAPVAPRDAERPWDIRTLCAYPDPVRANADLLADLEGGANSILLRLDPTGVGGVAIGSHDALARVLDGVVLELAPVALDAGFLGIHAADWLGAAAKSSPGALLAFHMDPLSALAEAGVSPGPIESHLIAGANAAVRLAEIYPKASLFLASGRTVHEAGGGEAEELGVMAASAVAYAKALIRAGATPDAAFAGITLGVSVDSDYFLAIAKVRAARAVWARMTSACDVGVPARIEARSSRRMLTRLDAWTNMLRLTAAGFGAAVGGADAIVLGAFTDALGAPTAFARRQARNTQIVLMDEANLGRVADPARGAGFIESLTDQLARAGWAAFQAIEAEGGIIAALASGSIAARVADAAEARRLDVAEGRRKIIGVTVFPNAQDGGVEVETRDGAPHAAPAPPSRMPGPDSRAAVLAPSRLAEPFEAAVAAKQEGRA
ncbi:MAG TPA: methylmalonyl-CoA mutase family protein [Caulobacteraceae bacterium]|jgi:methylmalonyl-CoA mutase|nr:methylmalonyl-CoA mutase family protein [Caulobacteraceae bacterium]